MPRVLLQRRGKPFGGYRARRLHCGGRVTPHRHRLRAAVLKPVEIKKNAVTWTALGVVVEAAGIEPASESPLQADLHT